MRDEDKPFVTTKGAGSFNIAPRNRTGWLYLGLWTLPALAIGGVYAWIMEGAGGATQDTVIATVAFVAGMAAWAVTMGRWMYARSEVIDIRKLTENKRAPERDKR